MDAIAAVETGAMDKPVEDVMVKRLKLRTRMKIGDKLTGRITGIQPYGAFVELETGVTGLIHISEIRTGFIENIYDILKIGDEVQVQVVDFDEYTGKASLSIRTLEEEKHQLPRRRRFQMIGSSTVLHHLDE